MEKTVINEVFELLRDIKAVESESEFSPPYSPGVTWIGWREWHKALAYCRKLGV